jgi:DNA-binding transcriptional regulator YiaG
MTQHDDTTGKVRVLDGSHRIGVLTCLDGAAKGEKILPEYDATAHVGLRTIIYNAAIERVDRETSEETIEVPKPDELRAAACIVRCLVPIKLRGSEIKAMRKALGLTLEEMAKRLDERTAAQTVSRWESDAQPMGGYAEKMFRLVVCEEMQERAPGVEYNARMIANLRVIDPWIVDPNYEVPAIGFQMIGMKELSGSIIQTWNSQPKRAA